MSRVRRVLYNGAVYHIVQRGHNRDKLFRKAEDYKIFKDLIRKYKRIILICWNAVVISKETR